MPRDTLLNKPAAMANAPDAPADMPAAQRAFWSVAVASRPSSEWTGADCALLALYVKAYFDVRRLDAEITKHGEVIEHRVSPRVVLRAMREKVMLDTAQKLRLCPASRYTAKDVGRLHKHASTANRAIATIDSDDLLQGVSKWKQ